MREPGRRVLTVLRAVILVDALVFLAAALFNMGATVPLGFAALRFPVPIWQAGLGEAVIGLVLLAAAITGRATMAWVAFWMSVFGIAFGLFIFAVLQAQILPFNFPEGPQANFEFVALAFIAGFSERLSRGVISTVEGRFLGQKSE